MSGFGWRPHIESALKLDVRGMFASGALRAACETWGTWQWTDAYSGKQIGSVSYHGNLGEEGGTLTLSYSLEDRAKGRDTVECAITLSSIPLFYGGRRWYVHCPYTGRRAYTLHKWSSVEMFCHRSAIQPKPTYASQRIGGFDRLIKQRWALRERIGDRYSNLFGPPQKPLGMHWRTFERYAARDAELAAKDNRRISELMELIGVF